MTAPEQSQQVERFAGVPIERFQLIVVVMVLIMAISWIVVFATVVDGERTGGHASSSVAPGGTAPAPGAPERDFMNVPEGFTTVES